MKNISKLNLENKKFVTMENKSGLSSNETIFHYFQNGKTITGKYKGGLIKEGSIIGKQTEDSNVELLYQCLTTEGELKAGQSKGTISETQNGKLKLEFDWNWLNGDLSGGKSEYIEIELDHL
ncbi:lipocalin/fatty-acid binding family protein [Aquimarina sp. M1]